MGGGGGSRTTETKTTNVTTTTTTNIRDIGLTGAQAVDIAAILETGATDRTYIVSESVNKLIQSAGEGWQRLIGGASEIANNLVLTGAQRAASLEAGAFESAAAIESKAAGVSEFQKVLPWIALSAVALLVTIKGVK